MADGDPVKPVPVGGMQFADGEDDETTYTLVTHRYISPDERHKAVAAMNFSRWAPGHDQVEPLEYRSVFGFDIVGTLDGSVYPGIAPRILVSVIILMIVKIVRWLEPEGYEAMQLNYFDHPYVFQVFTYVLGFVLVFRINLTYGRWWQGRMMLEVMSSKWFDAAQQACCFDQFTDTTEKEKQLFRLQITGLSSVLHACAIAELGGSGAQVPCLMDQLVTPDSASSPEAWLDDVLSSHHIEPVFQVVNWLTMCVTDRFLIGGWPIPSPILSRIYQELSNGMLAFHKCAAIKVTPFPFPFNQMVECALGAYNVTLPLCIDRYAMHWYWAILFLVLAEFAVFGLAEVAKELEQPFGDDYNDLPLLQYHVCYDLGLRSMVNRLSFEVPRPNLFALERVYKKGQDNETRELRSVVATDRPRRAWYSRPLANPDDATKNFKTSAQIWADEAAKYGLEEQQTQTTSKIIPTETKRKSVVSHLNKTPKEAVKDKWKKSQSLVSSAIALQKLQSGQKTGGSAFAFAAMAAAAKAEERKGADSGSEQSDNDKPDAAQSAGQSVLAKLKAAKAKGRRPSHDAPIVELRRASKESVHGLDGKESPRSPAPPQALPSP